ncbi:MAG TPA: hypothetical protein VKU85_06005, partial [bacterium]|nr:hypothetical protein [bacterium]
MSDLWIWPLVGALFLGLFLAAAVAARPGPAAVRLWLAVLLLTAAAFAGEFAAMRSGLYRHPVVFVTYPLFLVMGPAAWFLSRSLAGAPPGARAMVLHLLPAALMAADLAPYYADIVRSGGQPAHGGRTWLGLGPYAQCLLQLAQTGVYAGAAVLGFRRFERTVRDRHSGGLVPRIACLHRLAASLAAVVAVEFLATLVMMLSGQHVVAAEYGMGFAVAALVIALGWMVVREPAALDAPPPSEARYERSALSAEALSRYGVALVRA